jgi:hypothetical protein
MIYSAEDDGTGLPESFYAGLSVLKVGPHYHTFRDPCRSLGIGHHLVHCKMPSDPLRGAS